MATKKTTRSKAKQKRHVPYPYQNKSSRGRSSKSSSSTSSPAMQPDDVDDILRQVIEDSSLGEDPNSISLTYPCISTRQPYAGLILNGLKTIETRWLPHFHKYEGSTVAIHVAWKDWQEGNSWRTILRMDHGDEDIKRLLKDGEKHGRGVVAGLVDVGETWQCPDEETAMKVLTDEWEKRALLRPLHQKFLTTLSNPRWLTRPVKARGQLGVWEVKIPVDCF